MHEDIQSVKGETQTAACIARQKTALSVRQQYNRGSPGRGRKPTHDLVQIFPAGTCAAAGVSVPVPCTVI